MLCRTFGIEEKTGDNKFAPETELTNETMHTLAYNALLKLNALPKSRNGKKLPEYIDSNDISYWAKAAMSKLAELGLLVDFDGKLDPSGIAKRATMAQFFYHLLQ